MKMVSTAKLLRDHARDWAINPTPRTRDVYENAPHDSRFTNCHGERWWCKITVEGHLLVWGDDVEGLVATATSPLSVTTNPWMMNDAEKLWLSANLKAAGDRSKVYAISLLDTARKTHRSG